MRAMQSNRNNVVSFASSSTSNNLHLNVGNKQGFLMLDRYSYQKLEAPDSTVLRFGSLQEEEQDQGVDNTMSNITTASGEASVSSGARGNHFHGYNDSHTMQQISSTATTNTTPTSTSNTALKRKRNLPGNPDPDAEVIALSPTTLMATNRFVCEICNKGFQRDQNLQLHRRGHNLPWKLKQRSSKEVRKRVYICPEPSCVHHDASRALGDLTGIKKHFCRKHGEKKWKCDKCSKRYAVQSDWKAHSKTCGSREYRCDCGTLFSRRDSFITHRAFCDALAEESARISATLQSAATGNGNEQMLGGNGLLQGRENIMSNPPPSSSAAVRTGEAVRAGSLLLSQQQQEVAPMVMMMQGFEESSHNSSLSLPPAWNSRSAPPLWLQQQLTKKDDECFVLPPQQAAAPRLQFSNNSSPFYIQSPKINNNNNSNKSHDILLESQDYQRQKCLVGLSCSQYAGSPFSPSTMSDFGVTTNWSSSTPASHLSLSAVAAGVNESSGSTATKYYHQPQSARSAPMSATALLQKAALMGATTTSNSLMHSYASMAGLDSTTAWQAKNETPSPHPNWTRGPSSTNCGNSSTEAFFSNYQHNMNENVATMINYFPPRGMLTHLSPSQLDRGYESAQLSSTQGLRHQQPPGMQQSTREGTRVDEGRMFHNPASSSSSLKNLTTKSACLGGREFEIPSDRPTLDFLGVGGRTLSQRELPNLGSTMDMAAGFNL